MNFSLIRMCSHLVMQSLNVDTHPANIVKIVKMYTVKVRCVVFVTAILYPLPFYSL